MSIVNERCMQCGSKIEGGYCNCFPSTSTKIPMPPVKEPKTSVGSLTVDVGINGMDETIKQLQALKRLYTDIDTLQQRIIRGNEKISDMTSSSLGGRPTESYMEYMERKKI